MHNVITLSADIDQIVFISDLHLSQHTPTTTQLFRQLISQTANAKQRLFILGDLFDAWVGDEQWQEPWCQPILAALEQHQNHIYFIPGNRDFLLQTGQIQPFHVIADMAIVSSPLNATLLLLHGDQLCLADTAYQQWRTQCRNRVWQQQFLAHPYYERVAWANQWRQASSQYQQEQHPDTAVDPVLVEQLLTQHNATIMIHGHTHRPLSLELKNQRWRYVLAEWTDQVMGLKLSQQKLSRLETPL